MVPRSLSRLSVPMFLGATLAAASCVPPAPQAETPAVAVRPSPVADPEPPPSYPPVAEPSNLAGLLRIGSPVRDLVMWRDLLPAHTAFGQLAALGPAGLADLTFGSLGEYVDLSAPVDMAVLEEDSALVGSVLLRDLAGARGAAQADFDFRDRADGSIAVVPREGATGAGLAGKFKLACSVYSGGEPVRAHLVCSADAKALASAAPYLARTLSRKPAVPGIRFEMPASAMRRLLDARQKQADAKVEDDPAAEAGRQAASRWLSGLNEDFESLAFDVAAGTDGVNVGVDLRFRTVKSPLSVVAVGSRGGAVPAAFWSIPGDADLAMYLPGASPDALRTALGTFWSDVAEAMPDDEIPRQQWRDFVAQTSKLVLTGGPVMLAHGAPPAKPDASGQGGAASGAAGGPGAAVSKGGAGGQGSAAGKGAAAAGGRAAADAVKAYQEARRAGSGWTLFAVSEPVSKWTGGVRELLRLSKNPKKSGPAGASGAGATTGSSPARSSKPASKSTSSRTLGTTKEVPVRASEKLPAGTMHLVHHEALNPSYVAPPDGRLPPEGPYDVHVFVAGDAETTWIVVSENEPLARAKVQEIVKGTSSIQSRADLAPLRSLPPGGIGFATLRGLLGMTSDQDTTGELAMGEAVLAAVGKLPSAGTAPIFVSLAPSPNEGREGVTLRVSASISIAAALDLVQWFQ